MLDSTIDNSIRTANCSQTSSSSYPRKIRIMLWGSCFNMFFWFITSQTLFQGVCEGSKLSETKLLSDFIRAIDPENLLVSRSNGSTLDHCSHHWAGVTCDLQTQNIIEIRLENLNLSGILDAESLCKLPSLRVLNLANNIIGGSIPGSISNCMSLTHLNVSNNLLHGMVPSSLADMKKLVILDISNNNFSGPFLNFIQELKHRQTYIRRSSMLQSMVSHTSNMDNVTASLLNGTDGPNVSNMEGTRIQTQKTSLASSFLVLLFCIGFILVLMLLGIKRAAKAREKQKQKSIEDSFFKNPSIKFESGSTKGEKCPELVFFIDEHEEGFKVDLLSSKAELLGQCICSSLYKVSLENDTIVAVKRLKNLKVSSAEFGHTMRQIGSLEHPNILPLIAYRSFNEERILIYRYQRNGSLLNLLQNCTGGKRTFPWRLRLSISNGIAQGLGFMHQGYGGRESVPHGNLKPSNILLNENEEPVISEFGYQRYLDPKRACLFSSDGYKAPEKRLTEQADLYSFGIILLELLTGKTVERSGLDLPKWVKSMIREEWTGEVFDKEVNKEGKQWAFPLLNIALKCVSLNPESRPNIFEVLEKIEEVVNAQDDNSFSTYSAESDERDGCILHTVIPEYGETPGSIHTDGYV